MSKERYIYFYNMNHGHPYCKSNHKVHRKFIHLLVKEMIHAPNLENHKKEVPQVHLQDTLSQNGTHRDASPTSCLKKKKTSKWVRPMKSSQILLRLPTPHLRQSRAEQRKRREFIYLIHTQYRWSFQVHARLPRSLVVHVWIASPVQYADTQWTWRPNMYWLALLLSKPQTSRREKENPEILSIQKRRNALKCLLHAPILLCVECFTCANFW